MKRCLPWWARMGARAVISHMPVDYTMWRSMSVLRFGGMDRPASAYEVFRRHVEAAGFAARDGSGVLELGPGDSLFTALIARAHGASDVYLVDVGDFASRDLALYREMAEFLADRRLPAPDLAGVGSVSEVLSLCSAHYATRGLESLRALPDRSVDFIFSNAVLQHVKRSEFAETLRQLRRVLRPGGCCSHSVDLRDMMAEALNHLRFSEAVWESSWIRRCGFYSNRIRYSEMLEMFRSAGFEATVNEVNRWDRLPTSRSSLAPGFRELPDEELRVATFNVILRAE